MVYSYICSPATSKYLSLFFFFFAFFDFRAVVRLDVKIHFTPISLFSFC